MLVGAADDIPKTADPAFARSELSLAKLAPAQHIGAGEAPEVQVGEDQRVVDRQIHTFGSSSRLLLVDEHCINIGAQVISRATRGRNVVANI